MADKGQQTEQPTQRKLDKARREGQFAHSREFVAAMVFLAFAGSVQIWGTEWVEGLKRLLREGLAEAFRASADGVRPPATLARQLTRVLGLFAPGAILLLTAALAAQLAVSGMGVSLKKLSPSAQRLNPAQRLKELPGQNLSAFVKACLMLPVFGVAVWAIARDHLDGFFTLPLQGVAAGAGQTGVVLRELLWKAAGVFLVFGCVDLFRQKRRYMRDLRMSKQEIRDEAKEMEGNPQIKARIRQLQRERLRRRMMHQVPQATAVIVNPTHFAVAIRYVMSEMAAPVVVAKGKNYLALRIRQKAMEHQVPIIENPPLAQALYKSVEVGQEIPAHLYRAVAEILAYVYRLMKGRIPG